MDTCCFDTRSFIGRAARRRIAVRFGPRLTSNLRNELAQIKMQKIRYDGVGPRQHVFVSDAQGSHPCGLDRRDACWRVLDP
jgi:hypothetical protein